MTVIRFCRHERVAYRGNQAVSDFVTLELQDNLHRQYQVQKESFYKLQLE